MRRVCLLVVLLALAMPVRVLPADDLSESPADSLSELIPLPDYEISILPDTSYPTGRLTVGLALSGGGAKGLAHIGVLKVIEEAGLRIDVVTGTSMGSIIGGLYAIGYSAVELDSIVRSIEWTDFFSDVVGRPTLSMEQKLYDARYLASLPLRDGTVSLPSGLIPGQTFAALMNRLTLFMHDTPDFQNLPRPFACIATDLVTGKAVVLKQGQLSEAIRASMAIPSIFTPVQLDNMLLVDGGLVRNLPVQDAFELGADLVIAVDVGQPLNSIEKLTDIISIINQSLSFIGVESDSLQRSLASVLIEPKVAEYSITDFTSTAEIIALGEQAARPLLPRFQALADSLNRLGPPPPLPLPPRIDSVYVARVEIHGLKKVTNRQVQSDLAIDPPCWMTTAELQAAVDRVFSTQFFERVGYHLTATQRGTILTLHVLEKHSDFFRFGFRYDSYEKASVLLNVTSHNLIWNSTMATFDLILGDYTEAEAAWFFHTGYRPRIGMRLYSTLRQGEFLLPFGGDENRIEMKYRTTRSEALFGTIFSSSSVLGFGLRYDYAMVRPRFSVPNLKRREITYPSAFILFWGDTFDRANFATEGSSLFAEFEIADSSFGESGSYRRAELTVENRTRSRDWLTLISRLRFGSASSATPLHRLFMNAAFVDHVAAQPGELAGTAMQIAGWGVQIEPWHKRFIVLRGDLGNSFTSWNRVIALGRYRWGAGVTVGGLTVVGPISATIATGSLHRALFAVDVGFRF